MNLFGKEPQELALRTLIHDTNSSFGNFKYWAKRLGEWLTEHQKELKEKDISMSANPYVYVEYLKSEVKRMQATLDYYLEQAQNDFKEKWIN